MSPEYAEELARQVDELETENAEMRAEVGRLREALAQKCQQYDTDMETMRLALNREIEARRALEGK